MRRKIIRQKTAYTVTLPVKWVRELNLEKAGEVEVTESNNDIIISAEKRITKKTENLHLEKGIEDYYRIMIENNYLKGTDVLEIKFEDPKALTAIQKVVLNLIGFEIVDQEKDHCKISETAMPSTDELKTIQQRFFNIIKYGQETLKEALEKDDFTNPENFETFIADCRRYSLFCRRALHKNSIVSRTDEVFLDLLLERLVIASYHYYYMYTKLSKIKKKDKIRSEVINFFKKSANIFDLFVEMYHKKDMTNFAKINEEWENIYFKEGQKLLTHCTERESIVLFHSMSHAFVMFLVAQPNTVLPKI